MKRLILSLLLATALSATAQEIGTLYVNGEIISGTTGANVLAKWGRPIEVHSADSGTREFWYYNQWIVYLDDGRVTFIVSR